MLLAKRPKSLQSHSHMVGRERPQLVTRKQADAIEEAIPVLGFPEVLMRLSKDLRHGNRFAGLWRVLTRVYKV